jgi:hypothetical protein
MFHLKSAPDLAPLLDLVRLLEARGVVVALGGSGLLAALGLTQRVGDWDLTTDAELDLVLEAVAGMAHERCGSSGIHVDHKLRLRGGEIEVIVGFAIRWNGAVARIPTLVTGQWHDVPVGSPEAWAVAYALLGRPEKSALLFDHLARHGADRAAVERFDSVAIPEELGLRLRSLPLRPTSSIT